MPSMVLLRSRILRLISWVALALLCCSGSSVLAQTQPAPSSQTAPKIPTTTYDPTRPEVQPSLDVDRDPVLTPDPEDNLPVGAASPSTTARPGEIQKGQGGIYTLHENVNEVVLNCTV